ncbi:MAG TPA: ankyrin repeat domain-containing protein [Anaerolineaceae bacterium]|nr:ankyrin repeat domain-containing protein [Anaerolineaceae bacterium]
MFEKAKKTMPLANAILTGDSKQVRRHLEAGVDPNQPIPGEDGCPLHFAANSRADIIRLLIDHGADVNVRDGNGKTPLHCAAVTANLENMRALLENGADVNAADNDDNTPLMLARRGTPAAAFFANLGVPSNSEDDLKQKKAADLLLEYGAKE